MAQDGGQAQRDATGRRIHPPLGPLIDRYLDEHRNNGWGDSSYDRQRWALERLERETPHLPSRPDDFDRVAQRARRFKDGYSLSARSKGDLWDVYRQFCSWVNRHTDARAPELPYAYVPRGKKRRRRRPG